MRTATVEIFSDATNAEVLRLPDRQVPGLLVEGDTLHTFCVAADDVCRAARNRIDSSAYDELDQLRDKLWSLFAHYKAVLDEHGIPLPSSIDIAP